MFMYEFPLLSVNEDVAFAFYETYFHFLSVFVFIALQWRVSSFRKLRPIVNIAVIQHLRFRGYSKSTNKILFPKMFGRLFF